MLAVPAAAHATVWAWSDVGDSAYVFSPTPGAPGATAHAVTPTHMAGVASSSPNPATTNVPLTATPGAPFFEVSVPDGAGGMIVVWADDRNADVTSTDIYAQHLLRCGIVDPAWPADGVQLTQLPGNDSAPVAASDGSGGVFVSWTANFSTPSPTGQDVYAQHVLGSGTVDPAWPPNGLGLATTPLANRFSQITPDGAHGAYVVWDDRRSGRQAFVQHLLSSGVDPAWPTSGISASGPFTGSFNGSPNPRVCSDGAGGAIVAWDDPRNSTPATPQCDIFAQRLSSSGLLLWATGGVPATTAPGFQRMLGVANGTFLFGIETSSEAQNNPIVPDGAGGCFITWADDRNFAVSSADVYVQRLTSSGAVAAGWPVNGQAMSTAPDRQYSPRALSDGAGGAIVTWDDDRPGVFAQHVTGAGVVDGPLDGLNVCSLTVFTQPVAVTDGAHGTILMWSDGRNTGTSDFDNFAQHVKTSPFAVDSSWPVDGAPVSTAPGDQFISAAAVSDGAGGAIAAWFDGRTSPHSGLYAQRILASGVLPTTFSVSGHVRASCPAPNTGLLGVTVDAFQVGSGDLVATAATDNTGAFTLSNLGLGSDYTITVVTPLGYSGAVVEIPANGCSGPIDFSLSCLTATGTPRSMGYWKHEVGVATGGNGHADFSAAALCSYLDAIAAHFNNNLINQVIVYQPPVSGLCADKLVVARNLLNLQGSVAMVVRAKQQLMSLLLNVAAGQIAQTKVISADGATVSQAITYSDNQIDLPAGNHERAKTICDMINNGELVPAGMIPLSTQNIEYAGKSLAFGVSHPANGILDFHFSLTSSGPVELSLFDVAGRIVDRLVDGPLTAGPHTARWSAAGNLGNGLYFARLKTRSGEQTLKVIALER
jgi:hypothetical protein